MLQKLLIAQVNKAECCPKQIDAHTGIDDT